MELLKEKTAYGCCLPHLHVFGFLNEYFDFQRFFNSKLFRWSIA